MKKINLLLGIIFLLSIYSVSSFQLDYPDYMDVNVSESIKLIGDRTGFTANLTFSNNTYVMGNYSTGFQTLVTSASSEDVNFTIFVYNASGNMTQNFTGIMKFRVPFEVTLRFWKVDSANTTGFTTERTPYKNEFQFVFLQFSDQSSLDPYDVSYLDDYFGWIPGFGGAFTSARTLDTTLSFWGLYSNGEAVVKLYEPGNYTVGLVSSGVMGLSWDYEFIYPQFGFKEYKSTLVNSGSAMQIKNASDVSVDIYITMWEVAKSSVIKDWVYNLCIVVVGAIIFIFVAKFSGLANAIYGTIGFILIAKLIGWAVF
jgi:hypothetical protein